MSHGLLPALTLGCVAVVAAHLDASIDAAAQAVSWLAESQVEARSPSAAQPLELATAELVETPSAELFGTPAAGLPEAPTVADPGTESPAPVESVPAGRATEAELSQGLRATASETPAMVASIGMEPDGQG